MFRTCNMLGAAVLALSLIGCGGDANPEPKAEEATPTGGLSALEQMKQGGKSPQELVKEIDAGGKKNTAK